MFSVTLSLTLLIFTPVCATLIQDDCSKLLNSNITEADKIAVYVQPEHYPLDVWCYIKCEAETTGLISADGQINITLLPSSKTEDLQRCKTTVGKIVTCGDLKAFYVCFPREPWKPMNFTGHMSAYIPSQDASDPDVQACYEDMELPVSTEDMYLPFIKPEAMPPGVSCYYKCFAQKKGYIREDGQIDIAQVDAWKPTRMVGEERREFIECLSEIGNIEQCEDVKKVFLCFPEDYF